MREGSSYEDCCIIRYPWKQYRAANLYGIFRKAGDRCLLFSGDYIGDFPQIRQVMDTLYTLQKEHALLSDSGNKEEYILSGIGKHTLNGTVIRAQSECCDTRGSI